MPLAQIAAKGIRWTTLSMFVVTVLQVVRMVVLARVLGPDAFGLLAMMMVVIGFVQLLGQLGLSEAIIQHPNPTPIDCYTR